MTEGEAAPAAAVEQGSRNLMLRIGAAVVLMGGKIVGSFGSFNVTTPGWLGVLWAPLLPIAIAVVAAIALVAANAFAVLPVAASIGLAGAIAFSQDIPDVLRPDLTIESVRGNLDTRLRKLDAGFMKRSL